MVSCPRCGDEIWKNEDEFEWKPEEPLDGSTPDQAYFNQLPLRLAA